MSAVLWWKLSVGGEGEDISMQRQECHPTHMITGGALTKYGIEALSDCR